MFRYLVNTSLIVFLSLQASAKDNIVSPTRVRANISGNGLSFIENKGQVRDQSGAARNDIQFKIAAGNGLNVFIGNGQIHYQWSKTSSTTTPDESRQNSFEKHRASSLEMQEKVSMYRMDVSLAGANKNAEIIREEQLDYYENYYTSPFSPDRGGIVYSYKKLIYKNVYPNIDWVFYIKDNKLEYDFVVRPGGNIKDIKLKYGGATNLALNEDGGIRAVTAMGSIEEQAPYSYEKESGRKVLSKFVMQNDVLSFDADNYNGTLVIDPILVWGTYYGAQNSDYANSIARDTAGNIIITGMTNSLSNIATSGSYQNTCGGSWDAYIAKFNSSGMILWATYYGGSSGENSYSVACDTLCNIYITGYTSSTSGIATAGSYLTSYAGTSYGAFLAKFNSNGSIVWATYYGCNGLNEGLTVGCDKSGMVYFAGITGCTTNIATTGAYKTTYAGGNYDGFLAKFSSNGSLIWGTYFGGPGDDGFMNITCNNNNEIYLSGEATSTSNIATSGSYQSTYGGGVKDDFVAKFDTSGSLQWSTYFGGSDEDDAYGGVACDTSGNLYFSGMTKSTSNIAYNGYQNTFAGGNYDGFLVKFNNAGVRQWATYFGGANDDGCRSIAFDKKTGIYVSGSSGSTTLATPGSYQSTYGGGGADVFLANFNASGALQMCTYYGGAASEEGDAMICDNKGSIFISGFTLSNSNIATPGSHQSTYSGSALPDVFLAKFGPNPSVAIQQPYTDTNLCAGNSFNVSDSVNNSYTAGNIFTVQLSDASGSFTNAANIGSFSATSTSVISCTIPPSTPTGTSYRIRVIASSPADTSANNGINIHISNLSALSISTNSPVCFGDSLNINTVDTTTGVSYSWSGPNSFSTTIQNIQIPFALFIDSGMFHVTATLFACSKTDSADIIVKSIPAPATIGSNSPVCVNDSLHLTANDTTSGVSYNWNGPGAFSSSLQNPNIANVVFADSGWYHTIITGTNGCHLQDSVFVMVNPLPVLPTVNSNSPVCSGDSLHLYAVDTATGITFSWYGPNGFSSILQNPSIGNISSAGAGFYTVTAFLNACHLNASTAVTINPSPALPSISSNSPLCVGNTLNLNSSNSVSGVTFYWKGPNGFTDSNQNPVISNVQMNDSGIYKVYSRLGLCYSDTNGTVVTVNPILTPSVTISTNPSVLVIGTPIQFTANITNGGPFPAVQWRNNGVAMPGFTVNPCYITLSAGDVISVIVYSNVPCPIPDTAVSTGVTVSVNNIESPENSFIIYPNPSKGNFTLSLSGQGIRNGNMNIEVLNALGQIVYKDIAKIEKGNLKKQINTDVANGVYEVRLTDEKGSSQLKQVIVDR